MRSRVAWLAFASALFVTSRAWGGEPWRPDFGSTGEVFVSTERAAPLFILEHGHTSQNGRRVATSNVVSIGDTPNGGPPQRAPRLSVDLALGAHVTFGGAFLFSDLASKTGSDGGVTWGVAPRIGLALPVARHFSVWPRAGISFTSTSASPATGTSVASAGSTQTSATIDSVVAIFPTTRAAVTLTPSVDVPVAASGDVENMGARFMLTLGVLGRFDGTPDDPASPMDSIPARVLASKGGVVLSVDRLLPLAQYTEYGSPSLSQHATSFGITHAYTPDAALGPRLSGDIVIKGGLTLGGTASLDITPYARSSFAAQGATAATTENLGGMVFQLGARLGWLLPIADRSAIWLRGGLTYAFSVVGETSTTNESALNRANELYASLDPEVVFFVVGGFAITIGPVLDATLIRGDGGHSVTEGPPGPPLFGVGAVAGALAAF